MALKPADLPLLSRLLDQALDLPEDQIEPWLAALPPEQAHLAPRLLEMLASRRSTVGGAFLVDGPRLSPADESVAHTDDRVGPYRLIREIGRGGMGSVWLAGRADGSYQRQVALKLPRLAWGAGLTERMARERDIGTLLEHPTIARLYDAGVDEHGRPFLAFEYIDGQPIDAWCEAQALDTRARLRLFVQVARAVAYAHGRLVVHRDLKPSNVLVTADGHARLLDFGIAKLLIEAAPGERGLTHELGRVMTPHYASPEQIAGEAITVQSDVYSLGVLLYELVTGVLPHAAKRGTLGAVEDAILEGDAPLASSRVKDKAVARALRGEVDAILGKAMQRDAGRRYATADALAEDIERHLKGEAVLARPNNLAYRVVKAMRRNRLAFGATVAILLAVLGGGGVAVVQAQVADRAAARERIVKEFVVDVFKINDRGNPANADLRALPAEMLVERGARSIERRFAGQLDLQAELFGVVTEIFLDMGASKLAVEFATKHAEAVAALPGIPDQRVLALTRLGEALRDDDRLGDAMARAEAAGKLSGPGGPLWIRNQLLQADILVKQSRPTLALQVMDRVDAELLRGPESLSDLPARSTYMRARSFASANRLGDAEPLFRRAIAQADAADPTSRLGAQVRLSLAQAMIGNLTEKRSADVHLYDSAFAAEHQAATAEPRRLQQEALAALRRLGGTDEVAAGYEEAAAAYALSGIGLMSYEDADAVAARVTEEFDRLGRRVPPQLRARLEYRRGCTASNAGRAERGYALMSRSLAVAVANGLDTFTGLCLAFAATNVARHEEAEKFFANQLARMREDPATAFVNVYIYAAFNKMMQGRPEAAREVLKSAPSFLRQAGVSDEDAAKSAQWMEVTASRIDLEQGRYDQAVKRLEVLPELPFSFMADRGLVLGAALCARGEHARGLELLTTRLSYYRPMLWEHYPDFAYWRGHAGLCALAAGKLKLARDMARSARTTIDEQPSLASSYRAPLLKLEAALGIKTVPAR